jgi:hypothetical protein
MRHFPMGRPNRCRHGLVMWDCPQCQEEGELRDEGTMRDRSKDKKYNGWTNWDTWCLHLWITNCEVTYEKGVIMAGEPERFARWCWAVSFDLHQTRQEEIAFDVVNVEEIRKALLDE